MDVTFYLPDEAGLEELAAIDPDQDWKVMRCGQRWVLQTYLRLAREGLPVRLSGTVPPNGILVYHSKHDHILRRRLNGHRDVTLVSIRGDKKETYLADFEIVQNGRWADEARRFYVPYWPQPGIVPRARSRGERVENVAFKGFDCNLHPFFFSHLWKTWVRDHGLTWQHHSMPHAPSEIYGVSVDWHDYSRTDAVLALRPDPERPHEFRGFTTKPATKLYNAWIAGVPAVLAPEFAYREVGRPGHDYLEASDPEEVKQAILRLRTEPGLYRTLVQNGARRADAFTHDRIIRAWSEVLLERVPTQIEDGLYRSERGLPLLARIAYRRMKRRLARRPKR